MEGHSNKATQHRRHNRSVPCSMIAPIVNVAIILLAVSLVTLAQSQSAFVFVVTAFQPTPTYTRFVKLYSGKNDYDIPRVFTSETDSGDEATTIINSEESTNNQRIGLYPDSSAFGQAVPYIPPSQRNQQSPSSENDSFSTNNTCDELQILQRNRIRNIAVAIVSFAISIMHYAWQFTHPVTAVELLATMQSQSAPLTSIGNNGKPTVIDFWAPWCENCKVAAPTLKAVEEEYGDRVNFIMVNGDDGRNWPLIELFGVDAIPHLALVSNRGDVETALIGPMSRNVLRADIDALLTNREDCGEDAPVLEQPVAICHEELPYKMYDAFGNRPQSRRIKFVEQ
ncbi:hypothetical protein HJC23_003529 [Cyclotella cryptica]|uniref:Thioredoxin domain-containing protein n=1 Tax=Cyclotella cryptica TaxID=29204 RepID=A0ABD3NZC8_9STRA|eukprot:CCRYP_018882-RA/>CCRYP_018882-RA protein AED:0.19 eAED:0.19 QI:0/-1/0/1/-1/1/1/0/339